MRIQPYGTRTSGSCNQSQFLSTRGSQSLMRGWSPSGKKFKLRLLHHLQLQYIWNMIRHGLFIGLFVLHLNGAIGQDLSSYRTRLAEAEKLLFEDPAAVKPELDELLKISQGKPDTLVGMNHRLLSIYFGMTGMADSGIFHIHKAIELAPENRKASALKILALLHMGLKEFDAADSLLKQHLKPIPGSPIQRRGPSCWGSWPAITNTGLITFLPYRY